MNKIIKYKGREIEFHDLLSDGYNMDKFIKEDTIYNRPDHNFDLLVGLLEKGSIVYDLGAYIGTFSIPLAIEGMEVHSFEGFPDNFNRCKKNCEPFNVTNYLCAVSDKTYTVESKFNDCTNGQPQVREINYYHFDDYVTTHSIPPPDLVKVDIEGMETLALHGMKNLLENVRPIWSLGYHFKFYSEVEGYPGWVDVEDGGFDFNRFHELGYLIFDEQGRRCSPSIFDERWGEFILIPEEKIKVQRRSKG